MIINNVRLVLDDHASSADRYSSGSARTGRFYLPLFLDVMRPELLENDLQNCGSWNGEDRAHDAEQ